MESKSLSLARSYIARHNASMALSSSETAAFPTLAVSFLSKTVVVALDDRNAWSVLPFPICQNITAEPATAQKKPIPTIAQRSVRGFAAKIIGSWQWGQLAACPAISFGKATCPPHFGQLIVNSVISLRNDAFVRRFEPDARENLSALGAKP